MSMCTLYTQQKLHISDLTSAFPCVCLSYVNVFCAPLKFVVHVVCEDRNGKVRQIHVQNTIFTGYLHTFYTLFTRVKKKFMCTCSFFRNFYIYTSTCTKNTHFCCCFVYFLFFFPFRSRDTTHSLY